MGLSTRKICIRSCTDSSINLRASAVLPCTFQGKVVHADKPVWVLQSGSTPTHQGLWVEISGMSKRH
jgi:hypothetical protein